MPSTLHTAARSALPAGDQRSLSDFDRWLKRVRKSSKGDPVDGKQLSANLENEAHMTGAGAFGDPAELSAFLAQCARSHRAVKVSKDRIDGYSNTCASSASRGLAIPAAHIPSRLLRYSTSRYAAALLVERVLGKLARDAFDAGRLAPEDAFRRIAARWSSSLMTASEKLGGGSNVWATFRCMKGTPRGDAKGMAEALALPLPPRDPDPILFELSYPRDKVKNHRFPTVADAGLIHLFRPAREVPPDPAKRRTCWGFTRPLGGQPAQPEIVHDNASLEVLRKEPRFVGRIR